MAPATIGTAADVVASIEAIFEADRVDYEIESSTDLGIFDLETGVSGVLDNVDQAVSLNFDLEGLPGFAQAAFSPFGDIKMIVSEQEGLLMFVEGMWGQIPADQLDELIGQAIGIPLLDSGLSISYASFLFDSIVLEPDELADFEETGATRRIGGETLREFTFTVPGTFAAGTLVASDFASIAFTAPVADVRVLVEWWVDDAGAVRSVSLVGDEIIGDVYTHVAESFPQAELVAAQVVGGSFALDIFSLAAEPIDFPDQADIETFDLLEALGGQSLVGPGTCYITANAALALSSSGIIDCAEPHRGEVYALFDVPEGDLYPGEDAVFEYGAFVCLDQAPAYSDEDVEVLVLYPTAETWDLGDRRISCVFDLDEPITGSLARDPMDRVASFSLAPGHCLAPEAQLSEAILPLVDCAEPHLYEIVGVQFAGKWEREFPGDGQLTDEAVGFCNPLLDELDPEVTFESSWLVPTAETWALGDRVLVCIAEAFDPVTGSLLNP